MFFTRSLLIASVIGSALALSVSTQCQNTIIAVAASPRSECLNPSDLLQVFLLGNSGSVVTPVDTWLKGLCARGSCSNDDIASIVTNVTTGCATDLQPVLGNAQPGALTPLVQEFYPTVRKGVCLADASKNKQLCITQTLSTIERATGTLTIDKLLQVVPAIIDGETSSLNGANICTPCVKQIYNVFKNDFPAIFGQGNIASNVQANCGASFVDGVSDPNIVQTASSKTTSGNSNSNTGGSVQTTGQQAPLLAFLLGLLALAA
ncbi:hypothetical protein BDM02DRAFT_2160968 [Thelephora ganbajun]|uniref:Uncharacterized protein n=1 Tax=Thelephora ganbajun TaxID=370292 RepID=A0ACB6ZUJ2_THEGA|nr:hypothetical protein BDM02DRAFT_2160968 [Thelephora ganbajun]